ncbi:MAG: GNAT family N-acetyltransferase [Bifidobacteriaceae bacterium]|nr:GNAT family N-acetyltransferase [Bifidobacteriaceae bacterium]
MENNENTQMARQLPSQITIPDIKGEMLYLRPAVIDDFVQLDALEAFYNASNITGKDVNAERAVVYSWVRRSVQWEQGEDAIRSQVSDPEARRTIAWSIIAYNDRENPSVDDGKFIGMIFLIDIDGWSRSARIQIILGKDYRGRGYSRDAMPRVMTYGFAPQSSGLGMHRIWVSIPEKNTRTLSVYQSLGFVPSGTARDALWDEEIGKYQDLIVMDTLVDEFDPIRSLDAYGMRLIEDNPGVKEALSVREHSIAMRKKAMLEVSATKNSAVAKSADVKKSDAVTAEFNKNQEMKKDLAQQENVGEDNTEESIWPYNSDRQSSSNAWWRKLGVSRKRNSEGNK